MEFTDSNIAEAMENGIKLPGTRESNSCFIKLSLDSGSQGGLIYDLGVWGSVLSTIDGSPCKARDRWLNSRFSDRFKYISTKMGLDLASAIAIHDLHQKNDINAIAELLRQGEIQLIRIH